MVDITEKSHSLRHAKAQATVLLSSESAMTSLLENKVPKGNVFETARVAALYAAKKTSEIIPDCHPLPVEYTAVVFRTEGLKIRCEVEIKTIYKTGVEVEAMHAASVAALTIYDMLKPLDAEIHIQDIHLLWKKGGKSDKTKLLPEYPVSAAVLICSDSISKGKAEDKSGVWLKDTLPKYRVEVKAIEVVADDTVAIESAIERLKKEVQLVIVSGGTGLASRDNTRAILERLIDKRIDGIAELARAYSRERMPFSFLSNSMSGLSQNRLILSMPGSLGGVQDYTHALFPEVLHVFKVLEKAYRHDD